MGRIKVIGLICFTILQTIPLSSSSIFRRYELPASVRQGKSAKLLDPELELFYQQKPVVQIKNETVESEMKENSTASTLDSIASILFDLEPTSDNIDNMASILFDIAPTEEPFIYDYESELELSEAEAATEFSINSEDELRGSRHSPDFPDYSTNFETNNKQFYNLQNNQKSANQPQNDRQYLNYPQQFLQTTFPHPQQPQQEHIFADDRQVFRPRQQANNVIPDNNDDEDDDLRCIDKVMQVEKTVYDEKIKCQHTFTEKCHDTYITDFVPTQEKKCETSYNKKCHISYKPHMYEENVDICSEPLEKRCDTEIKGFLPDICKIHYETKCETRHKEHEVEQDEPVCRMEIEKKCKPATLRDGEGSGDTGIQDPGEIANQLFGEEECEEWPIQKCSIEKVKTTKTSPETSCEKIKKEICAPSNCKFETKEQVCRTEKRNVIQRLPEEECGIEPQENCNMETVLVPKLVQKENCVKVPKEICVNERSNPRKVSTPVVKEWCYKKSDLNSPESRKFLRQVSRGGAQQGGANQGFR